MEGEAAFEGQLCPTQDLLDRLTCRWCRPIPASGIQEFPVGPPLKQRREGPKTAEALLSPQATAMRFGRLKTEGASFNLYPSTG